MNRAPLSAPSRSMFNAEITAGNGPDLFWGGSGRAAGSNGKMNCGCCKR